MFPNGEGFLTRRKTQGEAEDQVRYEDGVNEDDDAGDGGGADDETAGNDHDHDHY